jgi:hypothetical protein
MGVNPVNDAKITYPIRGGNKGREECIRFKVSPAVEDLGAEDRPAERRLEYGSDSGSYADSHRYPPVPDGKLQDVPNEGPEARRNLGSWSLPSPAPPGPYGERGGYGLDDGYSPPYLAVPAVEGRDGFVRPMSFSLRGEFVDEYSCNPRTTGTGTSRKFGWAAIVEEAGSPAGIGG